MLLVITLINSYKQLGQEIYIYNYQIDDPNNYQASIGYLDCLVESGPGEVVGYVALDPYGRDIAWVRVTVLYLYFLVYCLYFS